jgi:hypothetical protein
MTFQPAAAALAILIVLGGSAAAQDPTSTPIPGAFTISGASFGRGIEALYVVEHRTEPTPAKRLIGAFYAQGSEGWTTNMTSEEANRTVFLTDSIKASLHERGLEMSGIVSARGRAVLVTDAEGLMTLHINDGSISVPADSAQAILVVVLKVDSGDPERSVGFLKSQWEEGPAVPMPGAAAEPHAGWLDRIHAHRMIRLLLDIGRR